MEGNTQEEPRHMTVFTHPFESNVKKAPTFSGLGLAEDPLAFLEAFEAAATWNNWVTDERKKELMRRCLDGPAKHWYESRIMTLAVEYNALTYADDSEGCLVAQFKKQFVTEVWLERYERVYESRTQKEGESPITYMHEKLSLLKKADPLDEKTEKDKIKDIKKGLLPTMQSFCKFVEKNPTLGHDQKVTNIERLWELFRWAESCTTSDNHMLPQSMDKGKGQTNEAKVMTNSMKAETEVNAVGSHPDKLIMRLERTMNARFDKIDNELAIQKDRIDGLEKQVQGGTSHKIPTSGASSTGRTGHQREEDKCYNCYETGHRAIDCQENCRLCGSKLHTSTTCSLRRGRTERTGHGN